MKKKFFLLKLDKNQNCRSFTHESLAIPRSDHHSHSLFANGFGGGWWGRESWGEGA